MTSTLPIELPQQLPTGRTVRDIVERSPELVNEVWCRKIFRQLLQSLELQYAQQLPHRLIMPDTIVFQDDGTCVLLPSADPNPAYQPEPATDLRALAAVIHYAITREMPPAGPLCGRGLAGYSESLLGAVDRCMMSNRAQRPHSIAELRDLLGIVSLGLTRPSAPAAAPPVPVARAEARARTTLAPRAQRQRWLLVALAAGLLLTAGLGLFALLRHTGSGDEELVLALPQPTNPVARGLDPNESVVAAPPPVPAPASSAAAVPAAGVALAPAAVVAPVPAASVAPMPAAGVGPVPAAGLAPMPAAAGVAPMPATGTAPLPAEARADSPPSASADPAAPAPATTTYKLLIKPWGTVYVDGKERGASPPLKRLVLPVGRHTIRLVNPDFAERVIRLDAGKGRSGRITHDFNAVPR